MLIDDELLTREDDHWVASSDLSDLPVPSSIQALLAARVEGLPADQWAIVTAASVEGTVFHRGAVSDLTPDSFEPTLELNLMDLVRRDVIRPDFADFPGDEAYRFRHALIRDAAYRSLSKGTLRRPARALRRMARARGRGAAARVRGDRRLPPRAGVPIPRRDRVDRHTLCHARDQVRSAARVRRSTGSRAQRPSRGDRPPRASVGSARSRRTETCSAAPGARGGADRGGQVGRRRGRPCGGETTRRVGRGRRGRLACGGPAAVLAALAGRRQEQRRRRRGRSRV